MVSHTNAVLGQLESVLSSLTDAETAQRGYLLTGQAAYLDPYHRAVTRLPSELAELRELILDNPAQTARALRVEQLAGERMAIVRRGIELHDAGPERARAAQSSRQALLTGEGKQVMDAIREEIGRMQAVEQELMEDRAAQARIASRTALASTLIALALGLALVAVTMMNPVAESLTRWGPDGDREKTRAAGFDVHLAKPVDPQAVETLLARVA